MNSSSDTNKKEGNAGEKRKRKSVGASAKKKRRTRRDSKPTVGMRKDRHPERCRSATTSEAKEDDDDNSAPSLASLPPELLVGLLEWLSRGESLQLAAATKWLRASIMDGICRHKVAPTGRGELRAEKLIKAMCGPQKARKRSVKAGRSAPEGKEKANLFAGLSPFDRFLLRMSLAHPRAAAVASHRHPPLFCSADAAVTPGYGLVALKTLRSFDEADRMFAERSRSGAEHAPHGNYVVVDASGVPVHAFGDDIGRSAMRPASCVSAIRGGRRVMPKPNSNPKLESDSASALRSFDLVISLDRARGQGSPGLGLYSTWYCRGKAVLVFCLPASLSLAACERIAKEHRPVAALDAWADALERPGRAPWPRWLDRENAVWSDRCTATAVYCRVSTKGGLDAVLARSYSRVASSVGWERSTHEFVNAEVLLVLENSAGRPEAQVESDDQRRSYVSPQELHDRMHTEAKRLLATAEADISLSLGTIQRAGSTRTRDRHLDGRPGLQRFLSAAAEFISCSVEESSGHSDDDDSDDAESKDGSE